MNFCIPKLWAGYQNIEFYLTYLVSFYLLFLKFSYKMFTKFSSKYKDAHFCRICCEIINFFQIGDLIEKRAKIRISNYSFNFLEPEKKTQKHAFIFFQAYFTNPTRMH